MNLELKRIFSNFSNSRDSVQAGEVQDELKGKEKQKY
jgi:hypothetical protein